MKKEILRLLCLICFLSACKRSDVFGDTVPNTDRVIAEFTDASTGTAVAHDYSSDPITVDLTELRLDPRSVTAHETKVRVIPNAAVVNKYNEVNGTNYVQVPPAAITLAPSSYALTPERRQVTIRATLRPDVLLDAQYAVGLSIAEMTGGEISTVAGNVIVFVSIKNRYDGIYSAKGYSIIPGAAYTGNFSLPCSAGLEVATSGDKSVYLSPAQPVFNAGSFVYINNLLPDISFDKATNGITSVKARPGSLDFIYPYDAAYNSRYDPVTKTIYVKYGVAPAGSGRYIIDTLVYCGPR